MKFTAATSIALIREFDFGWILYFSKISTKGTEREIYTLQTWFPRLDNPFRTVKATSNVHLIILPCKSIFISHIAERIKTLIIEQIVSKKCRIIRKVIELLNYKSINVLRGKGDLERFFMNLFWFKFCFLFLVANFCKFNQKTFFFPLFFFPFLLFLL